MLFVTGIDLVAPGARLVVEVVPVGKFPAGQKVVFDERERPFHAARAVGVADFMRLELETITLGEGRHLGNRHHVLSGAPQHDYVGVVDHDDFVGSAEVLRGLGQEHLAVKALEGRIELKEQHV